MKIPVGVPIALLFPEVKNKKTKPEPKLTTPPHLTPPPPTKQQSKKPPLLQPPSSSYLEGKHEANGEETDNTTAFLVVFLPEDLT